MDLELLGMASDLFPTQGDWNLPEGYAEGLLPGQLGWEAAHRLEPEALLQQPPAQDPWAQIPCGPCGVCSPPPHGSRPGMGWLT